MFTVVLDAMQHGVADEQNTLVSGREKHGFDLSPIKSSVSPSLSQGQETKTSDFVDIRKAESDDDDDDDGQVDGQTGRQEDGSPCGTDSKLVELDELQAALKAARLPLIGEKNFEHEDQLVDPSLSGLVVDGTGVVEVTEVIGESGSLLTLAQVQNVSTSALAFGAAHSQKRDYQTHVMKDKEVSQESENSPVSQTAVVHKVDSRERIIAHARNQPAEHFNAEKNGFDLSPVATVGDDPRGFDLTPASPFSPQHSPTISVRGTRMVDAEVEAIVADVKKVKSELQRAVNSTRKKLQRKKPIAAKFNSMSPQLSQTPTKSKFLKNEEPGYLKSTASTDSRYGWRAGGSGSVAAGHPLVMPSSHSLRQTQTLSPRKAQTSRVERPAVSGRGDMSRLADVETSVGVVEQVDAVQLAASVDSFASYLHQFVDQTPSKGGVVATVSGDWFLAICAEFSLLQSQFISSLLSFLC